MSNAWWAYKPTISAVDLLESGACLGGVAEAVERHGLTGETAAHVSNEYVSEASRADGSGYGYGDGYGDGSGSGYGYGYGSGSGYGYGDEP